MWKSAFVHYIGSYKFSWLRPLWVWLFCLLFAIYHFELQLIYLERYASLEWHCFIALFSLHLEGSQKLLESQSLDIAAEVWTKSLRRERSGSHVHCAHDAEILFTLRHQCREFATPFCFASDNIRHPAVLFPSGMSFLTTKEVMTFRGSLQSAQQVRQSMKEWASYPYWRHFVASVTIISFMVCLFWLPNNVNKAANVCASVAVRFMLKMMDLDDVTVEQCSRVTSSRWSFIFQVKVWPQVISSSFVVDNALKTCAANLRFFVLMALSTTDVTCVTLRLSKKWDPALLRPLLTGVLQGMHLGRIPLSGCPRTDTCWLWILEPHLGQLRCTDSQSAVAQTGQRCKVQVPGTVGANGRSSAYFRTLQQKFASTNNKQLTGQKLACQLLVVCACILLLSPKARLSLKPGKAAAFAHFFRGASCAWLNVRCIRQLNLLAWNLYLWWQLPSRHLTGRFSHPNALQGVGIAFVARRGCLLPPCWTMLWRRGVFLRFQSIVHHGCNLREPRIFFASVVDNALRTLSQRIAFIHCLRGIVHHWGEPWDLFLRHSFLPPSCKLEGRNLCFIRSLHTFAASLQEATFHWMSCVSLLIASIHTQYIRMSRCDVSFQTCFCDIKKFSLAMVHSSWLSWLDRRGPSGQKV